MYLDLSVPLSGAANYAEDHDLLVVMARVSWNEVPIGWRARNTNFRGIEFYPGRLGQGVDFVLFDPHTCSLITGHEARDFRANPRANPNQHFAEGMPELSTTQGSEEPPEEEISYLNEGQWNNGASAPHGYGSVGPSSAQVGASSRVITRVEPLTSQAGRALLSNETPSSLAMPVKTREIGVTDPESGSGVLPAIVVSAKVVAPPSSALPEASTPSPAHFIHRRVRRSRSRFLNRLDRPGFRRSEV